MKIMKLTSMADFVLEQYTFKNKDQDPKYRNHIILNYAKLLKQPLELGFFVPCDGEGGILNPNEIDTDPTEFLEARSRVLFWGRFRVEVTESQRKYIVNEEGRSIYLGEEWLFGSDTIEELTHLGLTLNDNALIKLGL